MVDQHSNVVINSKETLAALDYAKAMYWTFIEGTLSWLDPSNNKAFLAGEISLTLNRHIDLLCREEVGESCAARAGQRHLSRTHAGRPGRSIDRAQSVQPRLRAQVHQIPECSEGISPLHDGKDQYEAWHAASNGYVLPDLLHS